MNLLENHPDADPMLLPERDTPYVLEDVLEKLVYHMRAELILNLGDCFLRFGVDIDTDSITSQFQPRPFRAKKGYASIKASTPWKKYVGTECGWTWLAVNQQGYLDSVMLSFETIEPNVLLQPMASSIDIYVITLVERPRVSGTVKNGMRNAKATR